MIIFIVTGILSMLVLWVLFVNVMNWKQKKDIIDKRVKPFLWVVFFIAYIWDVLFNWVFGTLMFLDFPIEATLSSRLKRILLSRDDWRFTLAKFLCQYMIEPWDYNHCGLADLEVK